MIQSKPDQHTPHQGHPIRDASAERSSPDELLVRWKSAGDGLHVSLYSGDAPEAIDFDQVIARTASGSASVHSPGRTAPRFFALVADGHPAVVAAERLLPLQGTRNCRDLGGYETCDGRRVKWGKVYRSDDLAALTPEDLDCLTRLRLRLVCDLRGADETAAEPDRLPSADVEYLHLPISHETFAPRFLAERIRQRSVDGLDEQYMVDAYGRMIDQFGPTFGTILRRLAVANGTPTLFHCAGGKDRTGVTAALLLLALGVPEDTVMHDYTLTNRYAAERIARIAEKLDALLPEAPALRVILTAAPVFLESTIARIRQGFGSVEEYLLSAAGLDRQVLDSLRDNLLDG